MRIAALILGGMNGIVVLGISILLFLIVRGDRAWVGFDQDYAIIAGGITIGAIGLIVSLVCLLS